MNQSVIETSLAGHETLLSFPEGQRLFHEGEHPLGIYVLRSGVVDLLFSAKDDSGPGLIRHAQPGQILGLSCVVTQRPHDCTATVRQPCEVAFVERDDFLRTLNDSPAIWLSVLRILSSEVNAAYDEIRTLASR